MEEKLFEPESAVERTIRSARGSPRCESPRERNGYSAPEVFRLPPTAWPVMTAPSVTTSRGAAMSPTTEPVARTSSRSLALTFPVTAPLIVMFLATRSAVIVALGPMVKLWSPSSIDPSTWPSIVKSSVLMTLPSTRTDRPIHAASRRSFSGALGSVASPGRTRSAVLSPFVIRSLSSGCQPGHHPPTASTSRQSPLPDLPLHPSYSSLTCRAACSSATFLNQ